MPQPTRLYLVTTSNNAREELACIEQENYQANSPDTPSKIVKRNI
jgi:hypothetical protein